MPFPTTTSTAGEVEEVEEKWSMRTGGGLLSSLSGWLSALGYSPVLTAGQKPVFRFSRLGRLYQAHLLRDIFYPFHPVAAEKSWLTWNNGIVAQLAQAVYADRSFDLLPILADALQDAGCCDTPRNSG
jgi:hypothetical protein